MKQTDGHEEYLFSTLLSLTKAPFISRKHEVALEAESAKCHRGGSFTNPNVQRDNRFLQEIALLISNRDPAALFPR